MKSIFSLCGFSLALLVFHTALHADILTCTPSTSDGTVDQGWTNGGTSSTTSMVGESGGASNWGRATVLVFGIPKIAFGEQIEGATLKVNVSGLYGGSNLQFNGDLYSLGVSGASSISGSDYYNGAYVNSATALTLQQHFFSYQSPPNGSGSTSSDGGAALAADLNGYLNSGAAAAGDYYFLRLNPDFTSSSNNYYGYLIDTADSTSPPSLVITTAQKPQLGRVLFEYWTSIHGVQPAGDTVADLNTDTANFSDAPNYRELATTLEIPSTLYAFDGSGVLQAQDVYSGDRMRCYFYPPVSGSYTFALSADDNGALLFSTDGNPSHAVTVVTASYTGYQNWAALTYTVSLIAGQKYYMETQHKQGSGGENLSVGWNPPAGVPGSGSISLMPATYCSPVDPGSTFVDGPTAIAYGSESHPRLMVSPASLSRLRLLIKSGTPDSLFQNIVAAANYLTNSNPPLPQPTGNTIIDAARTLQADLYKLGVAAFLNPGSEAMYQARAYAELHNAENWENGDWTTQPFLDVAEAGQAFAIGYDWFYNSWTPAQRTELMGIIDSRIFHIALTQEYEANSPHVGDIQNSGNWEIVCNGGMVMLALASMNEDTLNTTDPGTILGDAMAYLQSAAPKDAIQNWGPDGGWYESPGYWNFASDYMGLLFASSETALGTDFGLDQTAGVSSVGAQRIYQSGPNYLYYSYGDIGGADGTDGNVLPSDIIDVAPQMQYFGLKYNQPVYSWRQQQDAWFIPSVKFPSGLDLVWYDPRGDTYSGTGKNNAPDKLNLPPSTYFRNNTANQGGGLIYLRGPSTSSLNAWTDPNALFFGVRTGYNGQGHGQLEMGSFVFDAVGVRWAYDLGAESYSCNGVGNLVPSNDVTYADGHQNRWQYYRCRAEGNNTLALKSTTGTWQQYMPDQSLSGAVTVTKFNPDPINPVSIVDLTSAYTAVPNSSPPTTVTKALRGFRLLANPGYPTQAAQVQDEITTGSQAETVTWSMHTLDTRVSSIVLSNGNHTVTLTSPSGNCLQMTIMNPPTGAVFTSIVTPNFTAPGGQLSNAGTHDITVGFTAPASTLTTLTINMCPYLKGAAVPSTATPTATALSGW